MRMTLVASTLLVLAVSACSASPSAAPNQPTAGSTGSVTSSLGAAPGISPDNPAYAENGAPRAGQPSGADTAGADAASGNYAPIQHREHHGGPSNPR